MASIAVINAVATKVGAVWTNPPPLLTPNGIATPPIDGSAFLALTFPLATEEQKSTGAPGANVFREYGAFRLVLSIPVGVGMNPIDTPYGTWFDALRGALRAQVFDGVMTFEASPPVVDDESDDGEYLKMSTAVAYKYDVFG